MYCISHKRRVFSVEFLYNDQQYITSFIKYALFQILTTSKTNHNLGYLTKKLLAVNIFR